MLHRRLFFQHLLVGVLIVSSLSAHSDELVKKDRDGTLSFIYENDVFANTDRNYTSGVRMSYMSGNVPTNRFSKALGRMIGTDNTARFRQGLALGHSIFTPQDTEATEPLPDQHPYAAWLYGEYALLIEQADTIDQFGFQLGTVGPDARGESIQNGVHEAIGSPESRGWDNQIGNEIGLVISYDRLFRSEEIDLGYVNMDISPSAGVTFGNIYTNVHAGITIRFGQDLQNDFGPPRVRPSLAGANYFTPKDGFSWYVFAGVEGRLVAHNIFLDGSLFNNNDPSVDSKVWVSDVQVGAVVQIGGVSTALTLVNRSDEFDNQDDTQSFGALSVSFKI